MEILDIILLVPFLWFGFKGISNGLFKELFSTLALFAAIYISIHFSDVVGEWIAGLFSSNSKYFKLTVLAITFIASLFLMRIGVWIADKFFAGVGMGWLNKLLGLVFGLVKALLLVGLLLYLVQKFDSNETLIHKETKEKSILFSPINRFVTTVFPSLIHFVDVSLDVSNEE